MKSNNHNLITIGPPTLKLRSSTFVMFHRTCPAVGLKGVSMGVAADCPWWEIVSTSGHLKSISLSFVLRRSVLLLQLKTSTQTEKFVTWTCLGRVWLCSFCQLFLLSVDCRVQVAHCYEFLQSKVPCRPHGLKQMMGQSQLLNKLRNNCSISLKVRLGLVKVDIIFTIESWIMIFRWG